MNLWTLAAGLAGGLGLFLLGMAMMTDGLRLAAGPALQRILAGATRTRAHALGSGLLVTALVQSSSAVTVAAIGFVNAGLLTLPAALWVLFGANVGTTMTGWIVALVGLKFKIEALALPLIGLGVLLRLTGEGQRRGALGSAGAGFGLLFLGISMLQQAFTGVAAQATLPQGEGLVAVVTQVLVGLLMTVLMQSSSASMAIALTAAQGGLLDTQGAAAVVIGANIGTTVTALLAAVGATSNARRAAMAHVVFNLLTGVVAFTLLPWLVGAIVAGRQWAALPADPAATLALFHTCFNLMGVLLMWPLAAPLTRWLQARFRQREEDEARPRHLDDNVLTVPALALDALALEVDRIGQVARRAARAAVAGADEHTVEPEQELAAQLDRAVEAFVERVSRGAMPQAAAQRMAATLRRQRYFETVAEQALAAARLHPPPEVLALPVVAPFRQAAQRLLQACDAAASPGATEASPVAHAADAKVAGTDAPDADTAARAVAAELAALQPDYERLKAALLQAGAQGGLRMPVMEAALRHFSALRRALEQSAKAVRMAQPGAAEAAQPGPGQDG